MWSRISPGTLMQARLLCFGALLSSTSTLAAPLPDPIAVAGIRPADGATIPSTPDIWIAFSGDPEGVFTGTFVDDTGAVIANANALEIPANGLFDRGVWSITADDTLPAGATVELVLQIPFGQLDELRFEYVVEQTPRPAVDLPALTVFEFETYIDNGEIIAEGGAMLGAVDLPDDVQGFIVRYVVDPGGEARDRFRTATEVHPHPALFDEAGGINVDIVETLGDELPSEVCVSLGAYTVSRVEIPVGLEASEMDCYPITIDPDHWEVLIAKRDADRILLAAEPDPLPPWPFGGCSQSGGPATVPFALLGLLCLGVARRRRFRSRGTHEEPTRA